jgi:hypothetical protein
MKEKRYVIGCDNLMESIFVPNMTDRQEEKSMQERLRDVEEDVFDRYGYATKYDELFYSPFELAEY